MFERFNSAGRAAWSLLGMGAITAVVFWITWYFRVVFPHIVFAGAIVFILNPIVSLLERRRVPRAGGTAIAYLGVAGLFVLLGFLIAPLMQQQSEQLADDWPQIRDDLIERLDELAKQSEEDNWPLTIPNWDELRDQFGGTTNAEVANFDEALARASETLRDNGEDEMAEDLDDAAADVTVKLHEESAFTEQLDRVREIGTRVVEIGLIFILGPIIAFYVLVDLPHIGAAARRLIPDRAQPQILHVARRLNLTIGGYFRGQLMVAIIVGVMVSVGLAILGLQFWIIVGMIAGVFNMIPLIGPWVGAIPGVAIAFTTADFSTVIWVVVIMAGAQQIDNHFISPLVMQRTTQLHPAAVMLALLAGGSLGGFFGLLLAVPLAATVKVIVGHLWRVYVLQLPYEEMVEMDEPPDKPDSPALEFVSSKLERLTDGEDEEPAESGDDSSGSDDE